MPYTSKRLTEYQQHWAHRPVVTFSRPCSPSASDSGLPDVFTEDGAKKFKTAATLPGDPTQPTLQQYDFRRLPGRGGGQCIVLQDDWQQRTRDIIKFCELNFKHVSWDDLDEPTRDEFIKMAPEARRLMTIKFGNVHLFAARIWRVIDAAIFQKTDTKSIKWTHDYFKYQDGMLKELRKLNPTAPHSHMTEMWQQWDRLSVCLHDEMLDSLEPPRMAPTRRFIEERISVDCFQQVIADGIGPSFPSSLCDLSKEILQRLGRFFVRWEQQFSFSKDYHYFLFAHPGTLKTSFTFKRKLSLCLAMQGLKDNYFGAGVGKDPGQRFEGRQVDLIVAPMVMAVNFSEEYNFIRIPMMVVPMVVCAGWIERLDRMEKEKGETMSDDGIWSDTSYGFDSTDEEEAETEDDAEEHGKVVKKEVEMEDDDAEELGKADDEEVKMDDDAEEHAKVFKEDGDTEESIKVVKDEFEMEDDDDEESSKVGKAEKDKSSKDRLSVNDERPTKRRGLRSDSHK
ncbi:hypothetical protein QQX98_004350 [Neonectria punicea]|uniref:Uncharacterized protein n=1 Tax=Neonectria punicea TaxID=979145 RepID=A0ABR1HA22_9HYPO